MIMIKAVMQTLSFALIGCLSNDAGDGYRNAASNFIALIPSRLIRQMLATFFGVVFRLNDCIKVQEKKKKVAKHFHVVVMQRRQRNVQKRAIHVQSYCFAFVNLLLCLPFSLLSPSSLPIVSVLRRLMSSLNLSRHLLAQYMSIIDAMS